MAAWDRAGLVVAWMGAVLVLASLLFGRTGPHSGAAICQVWGLDRAGAVAGTLAGVFSAVFYFQLLLGTL